MTIHELVWIAIGISIIVALSAVVFSGSYISLFDKEKYSWTGTPRESLFDTIDRTLKENSCLCMDSEVDRKTLLYALELELKLGNHLKE